MTTTITDGSITYNKLNIDVEYNIINKSIYSNLNTGDKTVVGAINEIGSSIPTEANLDEINDKINAQASRIDTLDTYSSKADKYYDSLEDFNDRIKINETNIIDLDNSVSTLKKNVNSITASISAISSTVSSIKNSYCTYYTSQIGAAVITEKIHKCGIFPSITYYVYDSTNECYTIDNTKIKSIAINGDITFQNYKDTDHVTIVGNSNIS